MGVIVNDVAVDILDDALKNKLVEVAVELVDVKLCDAEADRYAGAEVELPLVKISRIDVETFGRSV